MPPTLSSIRMKSLAGWLKRLTPERLIPSGLGTRRGHLCVYCFRRFRAKVAPYRCLNHLCAGRSTDDPTVLREWPMMIATERGEVIPPPPNGKPPDCPRCSQAARQRVCPHCHLRLVHDFARIDHRVIALVGPKFSGKSHVIASMVHEINAVQGPATLLSMSPLDEQTITRFPNQYEKPLYDDLSRLNPTVNAQTQTSWTRLPLLYGLSQRLKTWRRRNRACTVALFDGAGEDFINQDLVDSVTRYVAEASGIIFLLDPMQIKGVRARHPNPPPAENVPAARDILVRVLNSVRTAHGTPADKKLDVPFAVAVSKFDELEQVVEDASQFSVFDQPQLAPEYDVDAGRRVSDEVESLLSLYGCDEILNLLRTQVKQYACFGISATGCRPGKDGALPFVRPRRVTDPLLWVLNRIGFLKSKPGARPWGER